MNELDVALCAAHARQDVPAMVTLYQQAGEDFLQQGDVDAGCFFLTHAYVYALDCGHEAESQIRAVLVGYGREAPDVSSVAS